MILGWLQLGLLMITSTTLLLEIHWRWSLIGLAVQYALLFWVLQGALPLGLALTKLLTGWMSVALLGATMHLQSLSAQTPDRPPWTLQVFRVASAGMTWIIAFSGQTALAQWIALNPFSLTASLILFGVGLLKCGFSETTLDLIMGLLVALSGFDLLFAFLVDSVLMTGLLALVTLGLAGVGSYLITNTSLPATGKGR